MLRHVTPGGLLRRKRVEKKEPGRNRHRGRAHARVASAPPSVKALRFAHLKATVLGLPCVDRCLAHAALAGHVIHRAARLHLLQRSNDLRLRMPAFTHFLRSPVPEIIISPVRSQGCRSLRPDHSKSYIFKVIRPIPATHLLFPATPLSHQWAHTTPHRTTSRLEPRKSSRYSR